eukprot:2374463-Rhodomonas_salina.1
MHSKLLSEACLVPPESVLRRSHFLSIVKPDVPNPNDQSYLYYLVLFQQLGPGKRACLVAQYCQREAGVPGTLYPWYPPAGR